MRLSISIVVFERTVKIYYSVTTVNYSVTTLKLMEADKLVRNGSLDTTALFILTSSLYFLHFRPFRPQIAPTHWRAVTGK